MKIYSRLLTILFNCRSSHLIAVEERRCSRCTASFAFSRAEDRVETESRLAALSLDRAARIFVCIFIIASFESSISESITRRDDSLSFSSASKSSLFEDWASSILLWSKACCFFRSSSHPSRQESFNSLFREHFSLSPASSRTCTFNSSICVWIFRSIPRAVKPWPATSHCSAWPSIWVVRGIEAPRPARRIPPPRIVCSGRSNGSHDLLRSSIGFEAMATPHCLVVVPGQLSLPPDDGPLPLPAFIFLEVEPGPI